MKNVTIIVSDLHVGGGAADAGDDHVYHRSQFRTLIDTLTASPEGKHGDCELFINGDFLEFAQVMPEKYTLGSAKYWCSESESVSKLESILNGHQDIFNALANFQAKGNQITIAAGNHDVDFWWPEVQNRIRKATGNTGFALGDTWYERYDGRLLISHGHMFDRANMFKHWSQPILEIPGEESRLEMCDGTLFMVKFVNWLEKKYPFSDNIKPVTALARILWNDNRLSLAAVSWMLSRFMARHPGAALGSGDAGADPGTRFQQRFIQLLQYDDSFATNVTKLYQTVRDPLADVDTVRSKLKSEPELSTFLDNLLRELPPEQWTRVFDSVPGTSLGIGGSSTTLSIAKAGVTNDKEVLRTKAREKMKEVGGPEVVVMGHTHQPDTVKSDNGTYFNPGSWTRYVEIDKMDKLTLKDLEREDDFPYQLNYVRVERPSTGRLQAEMICYEQG